MTASVTRPPTSRATIASENFSPKNSAGSVRGSIHVTIYKPLKGKNGNLGTLRHVPAAEKALLRSSSEVTFDILRINHNGFTFTITRQVIALSAAE